MRMLRSAFAVLFFAALLLTGCQQLFTTSLAAAFARKSIPIPSNLSTSQASDLAAQAKSTQDTQLAAALVSSLNTEIAGTTDPATLASLKQSAAEAAVVASNAGGTVMTALSAFASGTTPSSSQISSIVTQLQAGTTASILTALAYLDPSTSNPAAVNVSAVNATDYVLAAAVIAASALPPGVDPSTLNGSTTPTLTAYQTSPQVVQANKIITAATSLPGVVSSSVTQLASFLNT
ncbi:MAG: hypothetical protein M0Z80_02635 [Treponema sp.]|nr:hypothetical protein [Treponema sp.]